MTPPESVEADQNGAAAAPPPGLSPALLNASALIGERKFEEAEEAILEALAATPHDRQALNLLALVRFKLGRLEGALVTYREIATVAPQDAAARRNLGLIALKLGRLDDALPELEMAVRLAPGDARAWSYLGYAFAKKGDVVEAAAAFRRAGQDALAVELEQAAKVRRPPTPSWSPSGAAGAEPPAAPAEPAASDGGAPEAAAEPQGRAVALAPPLPPLASEPRRARRPSTPPIQSAASARPQPESHVAPGAALRPAEATPVPLLSFVLSRLGQVAPPARPAGALRLAIADEAHVRADAILAGSGALQWEAAHRRAQGRRTTEPMGEPIDSGGAPAADRRRYFRLTGAGEVWIAGAPGRWLPVSLADDVLHVREDRVLAFDGSLSWEAGTLPGATLRMLQFRGRGTVALELDSAPVAVKVTDERVTLLAGSRLVGWVGRLVPHGARLEPGAPFQVACQGEGVVLLDAGTPSL